MPIVEDKYRGRKEFFVAYSVLIWAAKTRGTVTYSGVAKLTGLPDLGGQMAGEVGHLLGEISEDEAGYGRPMLSALVVASETGRPSEGFYNLARILGRFKSSKRDFWNKERRRVYKEWNTA